MSFKFNILKLMAIYTVVSILMLFAIELLTLTTSKDICIGSARAEIIYVDSMGAGNYTSIQEAIDNASSSSIIRIWSGTYFENLVINKSLTIKGNGTNDTIINGSFKGNVVYINSNNIKISNLTVTGSNRSWIGFHAGIKIDNSYNISILNLNCSENQIGIFLNNSNSTMIKNSICNSNNYVGIYFQSSGLNIIENLTCKYNGQDGIYFYYSNRNKIGNSTFNSNQGNDITLFCGNSNVFNSNIYLSTYGAIQDSYSIRNIYRNNLFLNPFWSIWLDNANTIYILNNSMSNCGIQISGESLSHWDSHIIDNRNLINNKPIYYWTARKSVTIPQNAGQIILVNCQNIIVRNQDLSAGTSSIYLSFSSLNSIENNVIDSNWFGIALYNSNSNIIKDNLCSQNSDGIQLIDSNHNSIINNSCSQNWNGISLKNSISNSILNNNVSFNVDGLHFEESHSNLVTDNLINSNTFHGLLLQYSYNNYAYHNNFISNQFQALYGGTGTNYWNNENFEGNYWSDYIGLDDGTNDRDKSDGIGDTNLPHLELDNYPFVNRSGWLYPGTPYIFNPGDYDEDGNYTLTWHKTARTNYYILLEAQDFDFDGEVKEYTCLSNNIEFGNRENCSYYYKIQAHNENFSSEWSNIVELTVDYPPSVPQDLFISVFPDGNALNISWTLDHPDIKCFKIECKNNITNDWKEIATINYPINYFNHSNLNNNIQYSYRILALDSRVQTSEYSEIISAIPLDSNPPQPPSGISISKVSFNSIKLAWEPSLEADVEGYKIYRSTTANTINWGEPVASVLVENEKYLDESLKELTQYYYVITAFDEVPNESDFSKVVIATTTLGPHGPEINNSITYIELPEDCCDDSTLNLFFLFKDVNGDKLIFQSEGLGNITVKIFTDNGTVILVPKSNWNGQEILTFYAFDDNGYVSINITINVTPVNDPPELPKINSPKNGLIVQNGTPLNFSGTCFDCDLVYGDELTFSWLSNMSGEVGKGKIVNNILLDPGFHFITLEVTDNAGVTSLNSINILILPEKELPPTVKPGNGNITKNNEDNTFSVIVSSVIAIVIIVLLIVYLLFKRRNKLPTNEKEKEIENNIQQIQNQTNNLPTGQNSNQ